MLGDFLRGSPVYQEVLEEGLEQVLAKACNETMQQL